MKDPISEQENQEQELPQQGAGAAERVLEHLDAAHSRKTSAKAAQREREETTLHMKSSRLQFTDEERAAPELEKYIRKSDKAADRLDAARAALPKQKKLIRERTYNEATGKGKTRLRFEGREKPAPGGKQHKNPLSRPTHEAGVFVHNKIHSVEKDNAGVEGAHKAEELGERGARYGARKIRQGYHSRKLKPYREAVKAEKAAAKANINVQYRKALRDNPRLASNPVSRLWQKRQIKAVCTGLAKKARTHTENRRKYAAGSAESRRENKKYRAFCSAPPGRRGNRYWCTTTFHYDFCGAVLLRFYIFRRRFYGCRNVVCSGGRGDDRSRTGLCGIRSGFTAGA